MEAAVCFPKVALFADQLLFTPPLSTDRFSYYFELSF